MADQYQVEVAAAVLVWLIHQPAITAPIASVTNLAQLNSFTAAINLKLSATDLSLLAEASRY